MSDQAAYDLEAEEVEASRAGGGDRRWWIIGILGCALGIALVTWFAVSATHGRVSWQTQAYDVIDDSQVTVTFAVHRPAGLAVRCEIKAMDQRFAAVGLRDVDIPAGPDVDVRVTETIRTTALAVTGNVTTCRPA